ncbi:MAG: serine/threonine protein kinase [Planctomycetales bacterium]|nr:serine/threonine protein kinase [Planctomycetales bacterium]
MDAKRPPATKPTDTQADNDKFATTRQVVSGAAPVWMQLRIGAQLPLSFGRYEMQRVLGEGAMAAVYLAEDKQLERQVAIKVPKFEPNDYAGMKRFYREARTMATLRHPHLCPVYDVGEIEGVHYFTMAYIEGGTLADRIASEAPMAGRRVAVLVAKIASALHAAHQTGTVHRDLKPANIMIDLDNEPVLMDFGLAGLAEAESSLTRSGEMIGTPAYMAPEQITGNLTAIGPHSDVYGLGVIMYEMLTGQLPFGGSVASVVQQALQSEPLTPTSVRPDVASVLSAICIKAMAREPADRYTSADELAIALRDFIRAASAPPPPKTSAPKPPADPTTDEQMWESDAVRVRELWRSEQFAAALAILERLSQLTGSAGEKYAEWARQEMPKVREQIGLANQRTVHSAAVSQRLRQPVQGKPLPPSWVKWSIATSIVLLAGVALSVLAINWNGSTSPVIAPQPTEDDSLAKLKEVESDATPTNPDFRSSDQVEDKSTPGALIPPAAPLVDDRPSRLRGERKPLREPNDRPSVDALLDDLDTNKDGKLALDEIPRPERPHLMRADTDLDGYVTREELDIMYLFTPGPPPPR